MANDRIKQITETIVIIPGDAVLMTRVFLPKTSRAELRRAVPYALEESLAQDIERCFFALGETDKEGNTPVAVIDRVLFESFLKDIEAQGWQPEVVLPDYLALPYDEAEWVRWDHEGWVSVRTGFCSGFSVREENLAAMLQFVGADEQQSLRHCQHRSDAPMQVPINLLQGEYRPKRKMTQINQSWKRVIYSTALFVFVLFGSQATQYFYFKYQSDQLVQRIATTYHDLFPSAAAVDQPRLAIEKLLHRLQHAKKPKHLMLFLHKLGPLLAKSSRLKLASLDYRNEKLSIILKAAALSDINALSKKISSLGFSVSQHDVNQQQKGVVATLEVATL